MKEFSVSMSLVDYVPVFLFLVGIILLQRDMYSRMKKGAFALFCTGTFNVFFAGFLKATYKLLYALGICDFEVLNTMFLPVQSIGFLLAGVAMISFMSQKTEKSTTRVCSVAVVPVIWNWICESVNIVGQGCFLLGAIALHKVMKTQPAD